MASEFDNGVTIVFVRKQMKNLSYIATVAVSAVGDCCIACSITYKSSLYTIVNDSLRQIISFTLSYFTILKDKKEIDARSNAKLDQ